MKMTNILKLTSCSILIFLIGFCYSQHSNLDQFDYEYGEPDFKEDYYDENEINELVSLWHPKVELEKKLENYKIPEIKLRENNDDLDGDYDDDGEEDYEDEYPEDTNYQGRDFNEGGLIQARGRFGRQKKNKKRKVKKPKKQSTRTDRITGVKFILQSEYFLGVSWTDKPYFSKYKVTVKPDPGSSLKFEKLNNKRNTAKISGLSPTTPYWVSISGFQKFMGRWIPETTIKVFTKPLPPENVRMIEYNTEFVKVQWTNPNVNKENLNAVAELVNPPNPKWAEQDVIVEFGGENDEKSVESCIIERIPAGTSFDLRIFYRFNGKSSKDYIFRITKPPQKPENTQVDGIELVDDNLANVNISWSWPENTYKVEKSLINQNNLNLENASFFNQLFILGRCKNRILTTNSWSSS